MIATAPLEVSATGKQSFPRLLIPLCKNTLKDNCCCSIQSTQERAVLEPPLSVYASQDCPHPEITEETI